jgi:CheY-like chemotaxis protein
MIVANTAAEILDALRGYFWLVLGAAVVWRLFPVIRKRIESEDFTVEVAGQKVSFSSASRQLASQLDDLRSQVIALTERVQDSGDNGADEPAAARASPPPPRLSRILWVDDRPENNAFLIQSLRDRDADVVEVASTDEALEELRPNPHVFDVVISDMGRKERGGDRPLAGVDLVRRMRDEKLIVPVVIYASPNAIARGGEQALEVGAAAATSSPTELLTMLRIGPTTAFEASVADVVRRHFKAQSFPIRGSVDFVAQQDGDRVGIEIKNWSRGPTREEFERALNQLGSARERHGFDRILMITRKGIAVPTNIDLPPWLSVLNDDQIGALPPT